MTSLSLRHIAILNVLNNEGPLFFADLNKRFVHANRFATDLAEMRRANLISNTIRSRGALAWGITPSGQAALKASTELIHERATPQTKPKRVSKGRHAANAEAAKTELGEPKLIETWDEVKEENPLETETYIAIRFPNVEKPTFFRRSVVPAVCAALMKAYEGSK